MNIDDKVVDLDVVRKQLEPAPVKEMLGTTLKPEFDDEPPTSPEAA